MPLVHVSLRRGRPAEQKHIIADSIYDAMRATIKIPENDRFITLREHDEDTFFFAPSFLGVEHTSEILLIEITLRKGRTDEVKQALYAEIAKLLEERASVRKEDVFITLRENDSADWSFGNGVAQYLVK